MPHPQIKFGTDGWRGVIADDFTFANVRTAAEAIAAYVHAKEDPAKGLCIGYDTRFGSRAFARACAEVVAATGIPVRLANAITPTPALSYGVRELGAAGGIMITSSHNPAQWNGVKYKAWYGGSGKPSIIAEIESLLGTAGGEERPNSAPIEEYDFLPPYLHAIESFAALDLICEIGPQVCHRLHVRCGPHHSLRHLHSSWRGACPDPRPYRSAVSGHQSRTHRAAHPRARRAVVANGCHAGLCTDGDADRIGATDEHGNFVDPHKIFAVLLSWVLRRKGWPGAVTRAFNTTKMLDRIAKKHGRELLEHGIGFKFVCDSCWSARS